MIHLLQEAGTVDIQIRTATVDDAADLFELNALFGNITNLANMKEAFVHNSEEIVCIAYDGNLAVGFCDGSLNRSICYSVNRAYVEALYVRESYRGQGIGKALLLFLIQEFSKRGILHFHTDTYSKNKTAVTLYESIGFVNEGAILLEKTIEV